ncbi:MAG: CehA/McbA family metallohydrolase [Bryobacteraceae bacterium]
MKRFALAGTAVLLLWLAAQTEAPAAATAKWYKGNLHTHTLNSDGDSSPLDVATWYRENGYRFLVLSDHNYLTEVDRFNPIIASRERFLLIQGEEVTTRFDQRPVHINAIDLKELILPEPGASLAETIRKNITLIQNKGAIPSLNHPNFHWAMGSTDLLQVENLTHFEVYNGHPEVNNHGGGDSESLEEMWDAMLTANRRLYGVAVDDAHVFKKFGPTFSNPGRGWVMVKADALDASQIAAALRSGDFYSSTGVTLETIERTATGLSLRIAQTGDQKYTTYFIGARGQILAKSGAMQPSYTLRNNEPYVRARIESSTGTVAWTQPAWRN